MTIVSELFIKVQSRKAVNASVRLNNTEKLSFMVAFPLILLVLVVTLLGAFFMYNLSFLFKQKLNIGY